jgi:enoyl-CoA hydratase/carnithine racemase
MKGFAQSKPQFPVREAFETLAVRQEGAVLFVEIAAPPMNLLGPALVRDLVSLIQQAEADEARLSDTSGGARPGASAGRAR